MVRNATASNNNRANPIAKTLHKGVSKVKGALGEVKNKIAGVKNVVHPPVQAQGPYDLEAERSLQDARKDLAKATVTADDDLLEDYAGVKDSMDKIAEARADLQEAYDSAVESASQVYNNFHQRIQEEIETTKEKADDLEAQLKDSLPSARYDDQDATGSGGDDSDRSQPLISPEEALEAEEDVRTVKDLFCETVGAENGELKEVIGSLQGVIRQSSDAGLCPVIEDPSASTGDSIKVQYASDTSSE